MNMKNKKLTSIIVFAISMSMLSGCGLMDKVTSKTTKNKTIAAVNADVDASTGKVIIFPMVLFKDGDFSAANAEFDNEALNALLYESWSAELEGSDKYIVPKKAIDSLPNGWEALEILVRATDSTMKPGNLSGELMDKFYQGVNKLAGKGVIAVSLVFQDEERYEASGALQYNAGLFDTESRKYKWITKSIQKPSVQLPYQLMVKKTVSDSWAELKAVNNGAVR